MSTSIIRKLNNTLLKPLFLVLLSVWLALPLAAQSDLTKSQALGHQVAGSYLLEFQPAPPLAPFQGLVTVSSDGTLVLTETTDFGFGNPAVFGFNSPTHGAWKKTDSRAINTRALFFNYGADGTPEVVVRVSASWDFARGFGSFEGPFTLDVFALTQDPLDPNEAPAAVISGTMSGRRITVD